MASFLRTATFVGSVAATVMLPLGAGLARDSEYAQVARGRYLVHAGDCAACHTDDGGKPFAGGRAIPTPFGTLYSTNITPDLETGIGKWSDDDFWNAMHNGIRRDGAHLYPAFPYPWYTRLGRDDVQSIRTYLTTLEPVRQSNKAPELPWPMSWRGSVAGWNALYFRPGTFQWNTSKSPEWNRGAYLVEGAGHCGACHSPKTVLGGVDKDHAFEGGHGEGWFATSLRPTPREGLGDWSVDEIVEYLKTGATNRARAMGPMAEVVHNSTRHLDEADLRAMATYLKDQAPDAVRQDAPSSDQQALTRGRLVYIDQCAGCHKESGEGVPAVFPPIKGNSGVHAHDPTSLLRLVLGGARSAGTTAKPERFAMPGFAWKLTDQEVADVLTYVRANFGNRAAPVSVSSVASVRKSLQQ